MISLTDFSFWHGWPATAVQSVGNGSQEEAPTRVNRVVCVVSGVLRAVASVAARGRVDPEAGVQFAVLFVGLPNFHVIAWLYREERVR